METRAKATTIGLFLIAAVSVAGVVACSSEPTIEDPQLEGAHSAKKKPAKTGESSSTDRPAGSGSAAPPAEGPGDTVPTPTLAGDWRAALASTPPDAFGGEGYCNYEMFFESVAVIVRVDDKGTPTEATVTARANERLTSTCSANAAPSALHVYKLVLVTDLGNGGLKRINLAPAASNPQQASLTLDGQFNQPEDTGSWTLHWHRTDYPSPLDWDVEVVVNSERVLD